MSCKVSLLVALVCATVSVLSHCFLFANKRHLPETKQDFAEDYSQRANNDLVGDEDEETLWLKIEATMKAREAYAVEALENLGVVAEGDDDEDSEEGELWKVVEGKAQLAEIV